MSKFIELDGFNGKTIINSSSVSSVHEDSHEGTKHLTIKLTDGSIIFVEMKIEDFYKLLSSANSSESL